MIEAVDRIDAKLALALACFVGMRFGMQAAGVQHDLDRVDRGCTRST